MKLYIAIVEDRHTDIELHPFTDPDKSVEWARKEAKERARDPEDYEEHDYGKAEGWLFYANYSCESDRVYVVEAELNEHA